MNNFGSFMLLIVYICVQFILVHVNIEQTREVIIAECAAEVQQEEIRDDG